jgi:hypothetical protein
VLRRSGLERVCIGSFDRRSLLHARGFSGFGSDFFSGSRFWFIFRGLLPFLFLLLFEHFKFELFSNLDIFSTLNGFQI